MKKTAHALRISGFALLASTSLAAAADPSLEAVLKPVRGGTAEVTAIEVHEQLQDLAGPVLLRLTAPITYANAEGIADRIQDLQVVDAAGPLDFKIEDDAPAPGGFPYFRHWHATREAKAPVTIRYRALVQPAGSKNGPPFGIRPSAGGVSGAGSGFLLLPENFPSTVSRIRWDLGDMPKGSFGVASFGEGDAELQGPPAALLQAWYLAGPAERFPAHGSSNGFSAAWLGKFPFDARQEAEAAAVGYTYLAKFFRYLDPAAPYRVFLRSLETQPYGGGTALPHSFMLSRGPARPDEKNANPRSTIFHEMIHQWTGGIEGPVGVTSWFSEGLTTHYQHLLPMRGGFTTVDEYGRAINEVTQAYYTSPAMNWPAAEIAKAGFGDEKIRHTPYMRGALYFADLDARIRAKSGGKQTLDGILRPLFVRRHAGEKFDQDAWIALVTGQLGAPARELFEQVILAGATLVPDAHAFGPCFRRQPKQYQAGWKTVDGFEWIRDPAVSDERCRKA